MHNESKSVVTMKCDKEIDVEIIHVIKEIYKVINFICKIYQ